jgi:hypothetical protein
MSFVSMRISQAAVRRTVLALAAMFVSGWNAAPVLAGPDELPADVRKDAEAAVQRGLKYLQSKQEKDGGWTAKYGPAVTAIVAQAFAQDAHFGANHAVVQRALASIVKYEQDDGGIYEHRQNLANYQTSVVLMFLSSLKSSDQDQRMARARLFLSGLQYDEKEKIDGKNPWYGGAGYNNTKRPDLSNTQMMLEALHQSGLSKDDPVYQRALVFVSHCQMNGATNDLDFAKGSTEGGFIYSPHHDGESKAKGMLELGAPLRSYGSMTYSGFKSMLYAGLNGDDPRVKAAISWIQRNYNLDVNPGMPRRQSREGLYYYYHVFSRALKAWDKPVITDASGTPHNWRLDLCRKLITLQRADGSWINEQDRWLEGDPNYITGLTVLSLQTTLE